MKIDIFTHAVPESFMSALASVAPDLAEHTKQVPTLYDISKRFRVMDKFPDVRQVATLALTAARVLGDPKHGVDFARKANDAMAELVATYPDRFAAGVASVPTFNMESAASELERAMRDLSLPGVQLFTPVNGRPLELDSWLPVFDVIARYDRAVWIHPVMPVNRESYKKYFIEHVFGWPYESTVAMAGLALDGIFERFPRIKVIIHHCGACTPFFAARIEEAYHGSAVVHGMKHQGLGRPLLDDMKGFYGDTALSGGTAGLMCGYDFFGPEHLLFGTDAPYDAEFGERSTARTIASVEAMDIPEKEKDLIYYGNAAKLLGL